MMQLEEIINRIKDIISVEKKDKKVFDKDVANVLGIKGMALATMKQRNKIPYAEIVAFCAKRRICINGILFSQSVDSLYDSFVVCNLNSHQNNTTPRVLHHA